MKTKKLPKVMTPPAMPIIWYWWAGAFALGGAIWGAGIWWLA